jgi:sulfite reductase (NADPH) flavoprotein alpha-component
MFRTLHRFAGIGLALILTVVSLTGVILSVFPVLNADRTANRLDAGTLAEAVMSAVPGAEQILVDDNKVVSAVSFGPDGFLQQVIDPATGAITGPVTDSATELWFENLHRALFLSDTGQIIVLIATLGMIALTVSGLSLAARRLGGWRRLLTRDRGEGAGRVHLTLARWAFAGLMISSLSGLWMGASTLGLIEEGSPQPAFPTAVSTETALPPTQLAALTAIPGDTLRAITLPRAGLPGQAWRVETDAGAGFIDPVSGEMLTWNDRPASSRLMDLTHLLHTGQGASVLGLLLGLMSLAVPVLSGSGLLVWLKTRTSREKLPQAPVQTADLIILVGSEGGSTWRFARAFAKSAQAEGLSTHLAEMNAFAPETYKNAKAILTFAATYGDGDAPASATQFLAKLNAMNCAPSVPLTVIGFGDSAYPAYCGFAETVSNTAENKGWAQSLPFARIDRQSPQAFAQWAEDWSAATGIALGQVTDALDPMPMTQLTLTSARIYGEEVQAPIAILRFALPKRSALDRLLKRGWANFQAGDLLNILPAGADSPRSYSLASATKDGFIEICVRKQAGGLCSTQLFALQPGDQIAARLQRNPGFHATKGDKPLILIGAGAGIGALAGMIRANGKQRPIHLFYGCRCTGPDLPYGEDLAAWRADRRLKAVTLAWSRGDRPRYVQQAVEDDAKHLRGLILQGAHVMICGGRDMGAGVAEALNKSLAPLGVTTDMLTRENRYAADVF